MNILVLCTGNSARSILLESILNRESAGRLHAWSAGSHPSGQVHPQSLHLLNAKGYDTSTLTSKSWDVFGAPDAPVMDMVITVCGSVAGETCPIWPGAPLSAHWGVEDPAVASMNILPQAFETAYKILHARAIKLLALPFETMNRLTLGAALKDIGKSS